MSLPRLLLIVAIGGLLGAVLVWGALALVYGPEVALVLRVLFSAAVAGVVLEFGPTVEINDADKFHLLGDPGGFLAGDPCAGAVYPSGGHGKRGKKRPGQWGWRARMLRARRLDRAEQRREREWTRRAQGRQQAVLGGRKGRRAIEQWIGGGS